MTHLTLKGDKYSYRTASEGEAVQVEVYYSKGGMNYFSGGTQRRGIYVSITPVKFEHGCISFMMFSGKGAFLMELKAKSAKKLAAVAEILDSAVPSAAETFSAGSKEPTVKEQWERTAIDILRNRFASETTTA